MWGAATLETYPPFKKWIEPFYQAVEVWVHSASSSTRSWNCNPPSSPTIETDQSIINNNAQAVKRLCWDAWLATKRKVIILKTSQLEQGYHELKSHLQASTQKYGGLHTSPLPIPATRNRENATGCITDQWGIGNECPKCHWNVFYCHTLICLYNNN